MLKRYEDTIKIIVGAAYAIFSIWGIFPDYDETTVLNFVAMVFTLISLVIGGAAAFRMFMGKMLTEQPAVNYYANTGIAFEKILDSIKLALSGVFAIFAIWQIVVPVPENLIVVFLESLFAILALLYGGSAAQRLFKNKILVVVSKDGSTL